MGQCATPTPARPNVSHVGVRQVDAVRAPHVVGDPPDALEVLDRGAVEQLAAVRILLDRLGEMRVQLQAEPARERGGLLHQPRGHRERRARGDCDLHQCSVGEAMQPLGVGENRVDVLDE